MAPMAHPSRTVVGIPRPEDEYPHPLPASDLDLPFKDTWLLAFHDDAADVTFVIHLTLSPNRRPGLRVTVGLQWERRRHLRTHYVTPRVGDSRVTSEVAELEILNPEWSPAKRLVLRLNDGDINAEFEFTGCYFGVDSQVVTPGLIPAGEGVQNLGHAEQAMRASGRLTFGDAQATVDGPAYRDRSWGFRKSDKMARHGYTFAQVHLPDAAIGLLAWQHPDAAADAMLPVGGWLSDDSGVHSASGGLLRLSAEARGQHLAMEFTNGRKVNLITRRALADLHYPYHEPEMDGPALGTLCWDQHLEFESGTDTAVGLVNIGIPFMADVLRHSKFCTSNGGELR
jgi:hypothetical protein